MTRPIPPRNRLAALAMLLLPLAMAACNGDQQGSRSRPAAPSASVPRATPAGLIGGHDNRTRTITGAGIAAIPAATVGGYVDRFERDLRSKTAGTGMDLVRRGNELILTLPSRITFDGNGPGIAPTMRTSLDAAGRMIAQYRQSYVDVSGFAEPALDDAAANALSQSQAQAIGSYLQMRGVIAGRIGAQGFGRSTSRRVEIKLVPLSETDLPPPVPTSGAR